MTSCGLCSSTFGCNSKLEKHYETRRHKLKAMNMQLLQMEETMDEINDSGMEQTIEASMSEEQDEYLDDQMDDYSVDSENSVEFQDHSDSNDSDEEMDDCSSVDFDISEFETLQDYCESHTIDLEKKNLADFSPFPSKLHALLYLMLHSPRPISEVHLNFIIFGMKQFFPTTPSLSQLKSIYLPGYVSPEKFYSPKGIPFYVNLPETILAKCIGDPTTAPLIKRYPVLKSDHEPICELYEAQRWHKDSRLWTPMTTLQNGEQLFIGDIIDTTYSSGKVAQFVEKDGVLQAFFHEIKFEMTLGVHTIADDLSLIPCSLIVGISNLCVERATLLKFQSNGTLSKLNETQWEDFLSVHHSKSIAKGMPVVTIPLILFCDDTSGNKSKQWNKFIEWTLIVAGLPQRDKNRLENIHFICCSNKVDTLTLAEPIVDNLLLLERGVSMYDVMERRMVLVIAPVILILADNPMSAELCSHQGSSARKFCRFCLVDKVHHPDKIAHPRTKKETEIILSVIDKKSSIGEKREMASRYGVRVCYNPLQKLSLDLHRGTPVECLHTILLGPIKYLLKELMERVTAKEKDAIMASIDSFTFSGIGHINGNSICRYHNSLVGRDLKAWFQIGIFIVWPFLTSSEKIIWLSLAKVFKVAYCQLFKRANFGDVDAECRNFVQAVKVHNRQLLNKLKFHMILHLPQCMLDYGGTASFNTERCESFNGLMRLYNIHTNRQASSLDIAYRFSHLQHLRFIMHGGLNTGIGSGLLDFANTTKVQCFLYARTPKDVMKEKTIYSPGVLRKVLHYNNDTVMTVLSVMFSYYIESWYHSKVATTVVS